MADKALVLDLTNYKDRRGSRVEPGKYTVVVEDVESNKSNAGNPYLTVWLRIEDDGEHKGDTLLDRLVLTEKSLWRVVAFLQAVNVPTPRKRLSIPYRLLVGKRLVVDVEDGEPYNGSVRSEVRGYGKAAAASEDAGGDLGDVDEEVPANAPDPEPAPAAEAEAEDTVETDGVETVNLDEIEL